MEILNASASIVSILLAILAGGLSIYFYKQSKESEKKVEVALESIRAQTETLQNLSARWMDRLTKYVTDNNPYDRTLFHLISELKDLPTHIVSQINIPEMKNNNYDKGRELSFLIAIYYYIALTNFWSQQQLPIHEKYFENPDFTETIKRIVNMSYNDFMDVERTLNAYPYEQLKSNSLFYLYEEAETVWKQHVKDSTTFYANLEKKIE